jgi:FkbM family methyltransferase
LRKTAMRFLKFLWLAARRRRLASLFYPGPRDYSQLGEERVLLNVLERMDQARLNRAYLDIGAFHPLRGSNTFRLYQMGWRGVVVDPNPAKIARFRTLRPDDVGLAMAVVPDTWIGDEVVMAAVHGNDARESVQSGREARARDHGARVSYRAPAIRISQLLDLCRERVGVPAVLNLDIEGLEWPVVRDMDLAANPVALLCIEHFLSDFCDARSATAYAGSPLVRHLEERGYPLVAICGISLIFARAELYRPFA